MTSVARRKRELQFAGWLTWQKDKEGKPFLPFSAWHTLPTSDQWEWWVGWTSARA